MIATITGEASPQAPAEFTTARHAPVYRPRRGELGPVMTAAAPGVASSESGTTVTRRSRS